MSKIPSESLTMTRKKPKETNKSEENIENDPKVAKKSGTGKLKSSRVVVGKSEIAGSASKKTKSGMNSDSVKSETEQKPPTKTGKDQTKPEEKKAIRGILHRTAAEPPTKKSSKTKVNRERGAAVSKEPQPAHFRTISPTFYTKLKSLNPPSSKQVKFREVNKQVVATVRVEEDNIDKYFGKKKPTSIKLEEPRYDPNVTKLDGQQNTPRRRRASQNPMTFFQARQALSLAHTPIPNPSKLLENEQFYQKLIGQVDNRQTSTKATSTKSLNLGGKQVENLKTSKSAPVKMQRLGNEVEKVIKNKIPGTPAPPNSPRQKKVTTSNSNPRK